MSNGVEVIVKGNKTAFVGSDKSGINPFPVTPHAITLPPSTVSRQFHLIDHPNKLNNAIDHLLHSIVRSVSPDLVTKTLLTTFTFFSTILENQNTVVNSHEETISNVVTQKFRPSIIEYTPRIQETTSTIPPGQLNSFNSYYTNTMTTTYVYYNTLTADSIPIVITRTELVSNVNTIPGYMLSLKTPTFIKNTAGPTMGLRPISPIGEVELVHLADDNPGNNYILPSYSRVFETETYYTTLLFSKTIYDNDESPTTSKILTTQEVLTQVVVTEALVPVVESNHHAIEPTPSATPAPSPTSLIEKTIYTTFTHFSTYLNGTSSYVQSSTHLTSNVVTVTEAAGLAIEQTPTFQQYHDDEQMSATAMQSDLDSISFLIQNNIIDSGNIEQFHLNPSLLDLAAGAGDQIPALSSYRSSWISSESSTNNVVEPVLIYATKTYYTTFTFFTSILGGDGPSDTKISSRTQVVSRVTTEALSTELNAVYLAALKQSYLSHYSTLLEVTSSVTEIIPTRTIEGSYVPDDDYVVTSSILWPHWPKDEDEGIIDPYLISSIVGLGQIISSTIRIEPILVHKDFEESMKSEIHHIVNVLTDTLGGISHTDNVISPAATFPPSSSASSSSATHYEEVTLKSPDSTDEELLAASDYTSPSSDFELLDDDDGSNIHSGLSHLPTPPLSVTHTVALISSSAKDPTPTPMQTPSISIPSELTKGTLGASSTEMFPDFPDEDADESFLAQSGGGDSDGNIYNDMNYGDISSLVDIFVNSKYLSKHQSSSVITSTESSSILPQVEENLIHDSSVFLRKTGLSPVYDYSSTFDYEPLMSPHSSQIVSSSTIQNKFIQSQYIFDLLSQLSEDSTEHGIHAPPDYYDVKEEETFKEDENDDLDSTKIYNLSLKETTLNSNLIADADEAEKDVDVEETGPEHDDDKKKVTLGTIQRPFAEEIESNEAAEAVDEETTSQMTTKFVREKVKTTTPMTTDNELVNKNSDGDDVFVPSGIVEPSIGGSTESSGSGEIVTVIKFSPNGSPNHTQIKVPTHDEATTSTMAPSTKTSTKKPIFVFQKNKPAPTMPTTSTKKTSKIKIKNKPIDEINDNDEYDEDAAETETATKVYNLVIKNKGGGGGDTSSDSDGDELDVDDGDEDEDESDEVKEDDNNGNNNDNENIKSDEENDEQHLQRRPPTMFSGPGPITTSSNAGVSTNSGGNAGGVPIVTTTGGNGINWKPLLNLGAIGLGGLGASTLTKLKPLLSSMAGYLKHGFSPVIARNDTQTQSGSHYYKHEASYPNHRHPSYESIGSMVPYNKEPNVIPVGQYNNNNINQRPTHLLRQPDDNIPRRPIISPANNEAQFQGQGSSNSNRRPPNNNNNNNNFKPPNDAQPNIYSISNNNNGNGNAGSQETGPHSESRLPSSHIVKVVAGNPINAYPVNRAPTFHHFLRNSGERNKFNFMNNNNNMRKPSFVRPPPRSQEGPPPHHIILPMPPPPQVMKEQQHQEVAVDEIVEENKSVAVSQEHDHAHNHNHNHVNHNLLRPPAPTEMEYINRPSSIPRPAGGSVEQDQSDENQNLLFPPRNRIPIETRPGTPVVSSEEQQQPQPAFIDFSQQHWPPASATSSTQGPSFHTGENFGGHENPFLQQSSPNPNNNVMIHQGLSESNEVEQNHQHSTHRPNTFNIVITERIPVRSHEEESDEKIKIHHPSQYPVNFQNNQHGHGQGIITRLRNPPQVQGPMLQQQNNQQQANFGRFPVFQGQHPGMNQQQSSSEELLRTEQQGQFIRQQQEQQNRPLQPPQFNNNIHIPQIPQSNIDHQPFRPILSHQSSATPFRPPPMMQHHQPHQQQQMPQRPMNNFNDDNNNNMVVGTRPTFNHGNFQHENHQHQHQKPPQPTVLLPGMHHIPPWPSEENGYSSENMNGRPPPQFPLRSPFESSNEAHHEQRQPSPFIPLQQQSHELNSQESPSPPRPLLPGYFSPTPQIPPYQQRPSTIFIVQETYDPPPTEAAASPPPINNNYNDDSEEDDNKIISSTGSNHLRPPLSSSDQPPLIINEILPYSTTTPKVTTPRLQPAFIRSKYTTTTQTPIEEEEDFDENTKNHNNNFINDIGPLLVNDNGKLIGRIPFHINSHNGSNSNMISSTSPKTHLDKYFTNIDLHDNDGSFAQTFSGSEDNVSIVDPNNNHKVIKSPFDSSTSTSTSKNPLKENVDEEDALLNEFTLPAGFFAPTLENVQDKDFWSGTTFRPSNFANNLMENKHHNQFSPPHVSSTTPLNNQNNLVWGDIFPSQSSETPSSAPPPAPVNNNNNVDEQPTTYRNILQPTTFRPNIFRRPPQPRPHHVRNPLHNSSRRPGLISSASSHSTSNVFYDDEEGLENIKLKNVEIHKKPEFARRPINNNPGNDVHHQHLAFIPHSDEDDDNESSSGNSGQGFKKPFYSLEAENDENEDDLSELINDSTGGDLMKTGNNGGHGRRPITAANNNQNNNGGEPLKTDNNNQNNEDEGTNETFEFGPPGYPMTKLRPPIQQPPLPPRQQQPGRFTDNVNVNVQNGRRPILRPIIPPPPHQQHPPGQHHSPSRPAGPFDAITNLFRRPPSRPRPDLPPPQSPQTPQHQENGGHPQRRPPLKQPHGRPQDNLILRTPQLPEEQQVSLNVPFGRPQLNPESSFNKIKPIPLNPAAAAAANANQNNANINHQQLRRPINVPPELVRRPQQDENSIHRPNQHYQGGGFRRPLQPPQNNVESNNQGQTQQLLSNGNNFIRRPIDSQYIIRRPQQQPENEEVHPNLRQPNPSHVNDKEESNEVETPDENGIEHETVKQNEPLKIHHDSQDEEQEAAILSNEKVNIEKNPSDSKPIQLHIQSHEEETSIEAANANNNNQDQDESKEVSKEEFGSLKNSNNNNNNHHPIHIGGHVLNTFRPAGHGHGGHHQRPYRKKQHPHRLRKPKPFPPKAAGAFVVEASPGSPPSSSFEIHEQNDPLPPIKTEMEPPIIDSLRHKPAILELPTTPPLQFNNNGNNIIRQQQHRRPINHRVRQRPNLLRPESELLKPTLLRPRPTFHTIASVDDDNKIVATNIVTMLHNDEYYSKHDDESSKAAASIRIRPSASSSLDSAENVVISSTSTNSFTDSEEVPHFDLASSIDGHVFLDSSEGGSRESSSVIRYVGGSLKTVALSSSSPSEEENEDNDDNNDIAQLNSGLSSSNIRKNIIQRTRIRISSTIFQSGESDGESSISPTKTVGGFTPINPTRSSSLFPFPSRRPFTRPRTSTTTTTTPPPSSTSPTRTLLSRRPFVPTRGPGLTNNLLPWNRRTTSTTTSKPNSTQNNNENDETTNDSDEINEVEGEDGENEIKISSSTSSSTSSKGVVSFSPAHTVKDRVVIPFKYNRTRFNFFSTSPPTTSSTTELSSSANEESSESSSIVSPIALPPTMSNNANIYKPTTFRPAIRPNLIGTSQEQAYGVIRTPGSSSSSSSTESSGIKTSTHVSISSTESTSSSSEEEESNISKEKPKTTQVVTKNGTISVVSSSTSEVSAENDDDDRIIAPSRPIPGIITKLSRGKVSIVSSVVSSSTSSTSTVGNQNNNDNNNNNEILNPEQTRYVTYTATETQTITETETTVFSSSLQDGGSPITHTIMITKTLPPQTLISTIIGSITLVNSVDVKPTTVRSTMYSETTKSYDNTLGSSSSSSSSNEKVLHGHVGLGGIMKSTNNNNNNKDSSVENKSKVTTLAKGSVTTIKTTTHDPIIDSSSTLVSITSKESSSSSSFEILKKKIRPYILEPGCETHNCSMQGNQVCKSFHNGTSTKSKCVCSPGYARMKLNAPCRPTFTYEMNFAINHMDGLSFNYKDLKNESSDSYLNFITLTKDALDKIFLATVLTRDFQGTEIMKLDPTIIKNEETLLVEPKVLVDFLIQLRKNMTTDKIKNHLIRTLRASNFTMGKAGFILSSNNISDFSARDFNECGIPEFNDCGDNAECINVPGSYRCQCQNGFKDRSKRRKAGRDCVEMAGCAECNYRGNCYTNRIGQTACNCFRWYGGSQCHINLKILLMSIIGIIGILFVLVLLCGVLICKRKKRNPGRVLTGPGSGRFMRYRSPTSQATLERTAIMHDSASSSSDGSRSPPVRSNLPGHHHHQHQHSFTPDSLLIDSDDNKNTRGQRGGGGDLMNFSLRNVVMDQQDRSLTVVIPRAKIRSSSRPSSRPNPASAALGPDTNSDLAAAESKLMSFLDPASGSSKHIPRPPKMPGESSSRQSTAQRNKEAKVRKLSLQERRISSGALVSSGTEVSARGGMRRRSTGLEPELPIRAYEKTAASSDVRSYDETTVRSHARPLFSSETSRASCYSCKPPSYCAYSESATGHTMAEKDGASTVYTTQGKLFRLSNDTDSNLSSD